MNWDKLSDEAKEVAKSMIDFCINAGYCMGMDEGIKDFDTDERHPFRAELEEFLKLPECEHEWYWDYACSSEPAFCTKCGVSSKDIE